MTHRNWFFGGLGILFVSTAATAYFVRNSDGMFVLFAGIFLWTTVLAVLYRWMGTPWRDFYLEYRILVGVPVCLLLYSAFELTRANAASHGALNGVIGGVPIAAVAALFAQGFLLIVFFRLLKAPTLMGAKVRDEIEGFKMFLEIGEKNRLETLHPPTVTPEVFQRFLPYAIAVDAENGWSRKFEAAAEVAGLKRENLYAFDWYMGRTLSSLTHSFASGLSDSLSSATASASTPEISVSAGHGGGFSGGGGGGW